MNTKNFSILQVNGESENSRYISFMPLRTLKTAGIKPSKSDYKKVYDGTCEAGASLAQTLENIYVEFNICRPKDFKGHSLSVSDIIEIDGKYYYCDSVSFTEVRL